VYKKGKMDRETLTCKQKERAPDHGATSPARRRAYNCCIEGSSLLTTWRRPVDLPMEPADRDLKEESGEEATSRRPAAALAATASARHFIQPPVALARAPNYPLGPCRRSRSRDTAIA
jgi:hypothetical protein